MKIILKIKNNSLLCILQITNNYYYHMDENSQIIRTPLVNALINHIN